MQNILFKGGFSMENKKINENCGSKRYVCSVYAETKSYKAYLGYYSYFKCDCGCSRRESQYGVDYRCCEQDKKGKVLSRTEKNPFTLDYPDRLKAYLRNPKSKSDVKRIVDALGMPEKVVCFNIMHETFITDEFGVETVLDSTCEIITTE